MTSALPPSALTGALEVYLLGLVDFDAALFVQERLALEIAHHDDGRGALLICEHPPLITIGREGSQADIRCDPRELTARRIEVRWLNRGGGCVPHVPGQLAAYPILPLARRGWGLSAYRERLELAVLDLCRDVRVRAASRRPEEAGVYCRGGQVAYVGVAVRSWISLHGLFVNVCPRSDAVSLVKARNGRASSLAAERGRPVQMSAVRESLIRRLALRLQYERYHLYTGHPLLRRTNRVVAYA
ncbi:MAG TPA: hypothetical protein VKU82_03235 [Planctomycetaceae bacterium]|nr:hypothetical protein [Planctomycetaceae bacterium]